MKASTERDYHRRIARVVEAILADPGAPHTVDSLAAVAHLSPFHFHRIYRALTGESVADTVQRLRLARAAHRLTVADDAVADIAVEVGYGSPQAFARAFRGFTGVSPTAFQARQRRLASSAAQAFEAPAAPKAIPPEQLLPAVELIELAPIEALCLRHVGPIATIGQTFRKLLQTLRIDEHASTAPAQIGICSGDPEEPEGFCYFAGVVPNTALPVSTGIEKKSVSGGLYAAHRLVGPYALIAPTFRALFGGWLPQSGYEPDDRPALELYRDRSAATPDQYVTDLLIPIREE